MLHHGDVIAGHRIDTLLGHGGSSEVYLAVDTDGNRVALKILTAAEAQTEYGRSRFDREFTIAHELRHPNIVAVYGHGVSNDIPYTTMQYVDGITAAQLALENRDRRLPPATVSHIVRGIAAALDYAHQCDILHRDVKPSNILVSEDRALLTDFGIARVLNDVRPLGRNGRILGSVPYAAPELLQAGHLDGRVDVYALACTFVELISGSPPFPRSTVFGIVSAHLSSPPPSVSWRVPSIPRAVDSIVAKALSKDAADRYPTAGEFVTLLTRALYVESPVSVTPGTRRRFWRSRRQ
ncbi:serine/threonine-protein kinase [Actinomycetes bacterium M1A6_2h]